MLKQNKFLELQKKDGELFQILSEGNIKSHKFNEKKTKEKIEEYCILLDRFNSKYRDLNLVKSGLHYYNRTFLRNRLMEAKMLHKEFLKEEHKKQKKASEGKKEEVKSENISNVFMRRQSQYIKDMKKIFKTAIMKCPKSSEAYKETKKAFNNHLDIIKECTNDKELNEEIYRFNLDKIISANIKNGEIKEARLSAIENLKSSYKEVRNEYSFTELIKYGKRLKDVLEVAILKVNNETDIEKIRNISFNYYFQMTYVKRD